MIRTSFEERVADLEIVDKETLLLISPSLKPRPGLNTPSASRRILVDIAAKIAPIYAKIHVMDLRELSLPNFMGAQVDKLDDSVQKVAQAVERAGALLFAVPGYWSGVSASFKNFIELLCGPTYDQQPPFKTIFYAKPIGCLVVGADDQSTNCAGQQAPYIFEAIGAMPFSDPILLSDPRRHPDAIPMALNQTLKLAVDLIQHMATDPCP